MNLIQINIKNLFNILLENEFDPLTKLKPPKQDIKKCDIKHNNLKFHSHFNS